MGIVLSKPKRRGAIREIIRNGQVVGQWGRTYNGKVDRGVRLGTWNAVMNGYILSPEFDHRYELIDWIEDYISSQKRT